MTPDHEPPTVAANPAPEETLLRSAANTVLDAELAVEEVRGSPHDGGLLYSTNVNSALLAQARAVAAFEDVATPAAILALLAECAALRAPQTPPPIDLYAFAYGVAQQVHAACEREEGFGAGNSDWSVPLRRIAREAADAVAASSEKREP